MAAPKRSHYEAERDRLEISALFLRGCTHQEITNEINKKYYSNDPLSRQSISREISVILNHWRKDRAYNIDQQRAAELTKTDNLESTYWGAWERSMLDAQKKTEKSILGDGILRNEESIVTEPQVGDPRFLQGIQWCIERRCKLLGLDAPVRQDITTLGESLDIGAWMTDRKKRIEEASGLEEIE